ncbi:probable G-protein coupled receptor 33 [Anolis sagrei]|uniref:probable G-protein coupled receptor 33 n=1 Tax=Anolis sagrei TaxID=38937 RepID=UPI00351FFC78
MDKTKPMKYISVKEMNTSYNSEASINIALGSFVLVSFLLGMGMNGTIFWLLWRKMTRTLNTLWFLHLTLSYLIACCTLPFFGIYNVLNLHWVFKDVVCKLVFFFLTLGMVSTVFLLTTISLDRYLLICHPVWSQHNRTIPRAWKLITGVWLLSVCISAPYLAFSETQEADKDRSTCKINYTVYEKWDGKKMELVFIVIRFSLNFWLPFFIIMFCYCSVGWEMKKKRLARTGKPFKVLGVAVASFFIFRVPFYLYMCFRLTPLEETQEHLRITFHIGICLNICFTPVLYLFVGEKFQQVFKMSIVVLLKKAFTEDPRMLVDVANLRTEEMQIRVVHSG